MLASSAVIITTFGRAAYAGRVLGAAARGSVPTVTGNSPARTDWWIATAARGGVGSSAWQDRAPTAATATDSEAASAARGRCMGCSWRVGPDGSRGHEGETDEQPAADRRGASPECGKSGAVPQGVRGDPGAASIRSTNSHA